MSFIGSLKLGLKCCQKARVFAYHHAASEFALVHIHPSEYLEDPVIGRYRSLGPAINSMSSLAGISLTVFGILVFIGTLFGWFYLAYYCNVLASGKGGLSSCLTFYSAIQIKQQGLASYPPSILVAAFVFGMVLLVCGTVLIATKRN
jgi:hypothetical protein